MSSKLTPPKEIRMAQPEPLLLRAAPVIIISALLLLLVVFGMLIIHLSKGPYLHNAAESLPLNEERIREAVPPTAPSP